MTPLDHTGPRHRADRPRDTGEGADRVMERHERMAAEMRQVNERLLTAGIREQELRAEAEAAREQVTGILESINDAFYAVDREWRFTYVNRRAEELWGRSREALLGKNIWEAFPEAVGAESYRQIRRAMEEGITTEFETVSPILGVWIAGRAHPSSDGVSVYFWDITQRKRMERALHVLAKAGELLASPFDFRARLENLARLAVPDLADWCVVDILKEDGSIERLAVAHEAPQKVSLAYELQARYPPDPEAPHGVPHVLRTGEPEMVPEIPDSLLEEVAREERHLEILRELGLKSYMAVPMVARGRTLGAISFVTAESGRRYDEKDLTVVQTLVRRASLAVDNARLYEEARKEIAERERAEEALRESEERFRLLAEEAVEGIVLTEDGRIIDANRSFLEMSGYNLEELIGMDAVQLAPPDLREEIARRISTKNTEPYEARGLRKDGTVFPVEVRPRHIPYHGRRIRVTSVLDLTERKRAEEALRRSASNLAEAQRMAHVGSWNYDVGKDEAYWSDELYRIFGFAPQEFVPTYKKFLDFVYPDDKRLVRRTVRQALYEVDRSSVEYRIVRPDGEIRVVHTRYEAVRDPSGRPVRLVGMIQDITERKMAEEALRASEARLRLALEAAEFGDWELDLGTLKARRSPRHDRIFGYEEMLPEWTFEMFLEHVLPEDRASVAEMFQYALANNTDWNFECRIRRADGEVRWIWARGHSYFDAGGTPTHVLGLVNDITERKRTEEALREIREAERKRIARDLHDGPLQDIAYAVQGMEIFRVVPPEEAPRDVLEEATQALRRSVRGVREAVHDLRREERDQPLSKLLEALVEDHRAMAPDQDVRLSVDEELAAAPLWEGAKKDLLSIVREALTNARRHSGAHNVWVSVRFDGGQLIAEVSDDGRGFDPGTPGSGVGLSSMRERAAALGGELEVKSEPGEGSRMRFRASMPDLLRRTSGDAPNGGGR